MTLGVGLKFRMQSKDRFLDRAGAKQIDPVLRRFFSWSGNAVRREARKTLRIKRKKISELTDEELSRYRSAQRRYKADASRAKPRLPKKSAAPGEPAHIQFKPNPLRDGSTGVLFTLDDDSKAVVIGPSPSGDRAAETIETRNPFMAPALEKIRPQLPALLQRAAG